MAKRYHVAFSLRRIVNPAAAARAAAAAAVVVVVVVDVAVVVIVVVVVAPANVRCVAFPLFLTVGSS